jgi:hypothetical protein
MKEARPASPPVVPVEATPTLRFRCCMIVIFFLTQGLFCKILVCNLNEILYRVFGSTLLEPRYDKLPFFYN